MGRSALRQVALCAALVVLASSCSSSDGDDTAATGAGDSAAESSAEAGGRGEAVPVTMQPDVATTVTAIIGSEGGTVAATAADGTAYALQIPAGALPGTVDITMTPLAGMTGLPDGTSLTFGVSLEPDGLVFAKPSWLYVTSDTDPDEVLSGLVVDDDLASLRGIGYDGVRFVLAVGHFSGSGGVGCFPNCGGPGGGWPGPPGGGRTPPPPGSPGGGPIQPPGSGVPPYEPPGTPPGPGADPGAGGGPPGGGASLTDGLGGGTPNDGGGNGGSGDLKGEVADALGDLGDAQLSGDEEAQQRAEEKLDTVKEKVKNKVWEIAEQCVNEKDITTLKELIYWQTIGSLLGYAKDDDEESKLFSLIETCNRFEMDSKGEMIFTLGGDVFRVGDSMDLKIPLLMDGLGYQGNASGTVKPLGYDRGVELLELFGQGMGAFMGIDVPNDVSQNTFISCSTDPGAGMLAAVGANLISGDITVNFVPSKTAEATVSCPDPIGSFPIEPFITELTAYTESDFPGASESGILLEGWERGEGSTATKSIIHKISEEGAELTITWQYEIVHAPGPLPKR